MEGTDWFSKEMDSLMGIMNVCIGTVNLFHGSPALLILTVEKKMCHIKAGNNIEIIA